MGLAIFGLVLVLVAMVFQAMINSLFKSQTKKYIEGKEEHRIESLEVLSEKIKSIGNMGIQDAIVEDGILKVVCNRKKYEIADVDGIAVVEYNSKQMFEFSRLGRLINIFKMIACTKKAALINTILDQALEIQDASSKKVNGKVNFRITAFYICLLLGIVLFIVGLFKFKDVHDEQFYNIIKNNIYKDNVSYGTIFEKSLENAEWSTFDGEDGGNVRAIVEINATVASTKEKIVIQFASGLGMKRSYNPKEFELLAIEVNGEAVGPGEKMAELYLYTIRINDEKPTDASSEETADNTETQESNDNENVQGTDENTEMINFVKEGHPKLIPNITYDQAYSNFFGEPKWTYFDADDGSKVVEFSGNATYDNQPAKIYIQFVIDESDDSFQFYHAKVTVDGETVTASEEVQNELMFNPFRDYANDVLGEPLSEEVEEAYCN